MADAALRRAVVALGLALPLAAVAAGAGVAPEAEARLQRIASELRCLVCQNQSLADSDAPLAEDLRRQLRELLARGATDEQVIGYMTARYGDFVLYRPPLKAATWALWFGPGVLAVGGLAALLVTLRRRSRLPAERFEPDGEDGDSEDEGDRDR